MNKRNLQLIETEMGLITAAKKKALREMQIFIKLAHEQLEQRKNYLQNEILGLFSTQESVLLHKHSEIRKTIKLINDNITQSEKIMQMGDVSKLKPLCDGLKIANEKTHSVLSHLDLGEDYLVFYSNKAVSEFTDCLSTLGQPYYRGFLPTMIRLQALESNVGLETELNVDVHNYNGDKVPVPSDYFSIQITDPTDAPLHIELCTTGPNCTVRFTPTVSGLHKVYGFFLEQKLISEQTHISVRSNKPVLKFGAYGNGQGTFKFPRSIAIDNNDIIYVADCGNRLIQTFSANGDFLSQFNMDEYDKNCAAINMALDPNNGLLYCTYTLMMGYHCTDPNRMIVFNRDGKPQSKHHFSGDPVSIAINSHGDLFIADSGKNCLLQVGKQGNEVHRMGCFGYPADVTIADDDSIIVSDCANDCIHVLNPDGSARHKFGSSGSGEGQLKQPRGVATDGENILVADSGNKRIQIYQFDGTFVSMISSEDDPLYHPMGLTVSKDGFVYVADSSNHCIKKYKY